MAKSAMTDFLVTFFVGDQATSYLLSDVVKNREDRAFFQSLGLPQGFVIPFAQENGGDSVAYVYKPEWKEGYEVTLNGQPCQEHVIQSGDSFTFQAAGEAPIRMLFLRSQDLSLGYKKYKLPRNTNLFIGRLPVNDIAYSFSDYISREKHAALRIDEKGDAFIEDLKRTVGVYVNGRRVHSQKLERFDDIFLMGLSMVYLGDAIAIRNFQTEVSLPEMTSFPAKAPKSEPKEKQYVVTTPRILKSLDEDEIEIDEPPSPFTADKTPAALVIGPSLTMSLAMMVSLGVSISHAIYGGNLTTILTSGTMAIGMLLGSLMWPMLLRSYQKRRMLAEEKHRKARYASYLAAIEADVLAKQERNVRLLNENLHPSPDTLCSFLDQERDRLRLWERSSDDADFLDVRLGLGNKPSQVRLKVPKQGFRLYEDELRQLPAQLAAQYGSLSGVPLTLNLRQNHTIGIIGSETNIRTLLNEILLNVIALHAYHEVKLVLVIPPSQVPEFDAFQNVPHVWSNDKKVRFFATRTDEVHHIFTVIDDAIQQRAASQEQGQNPVPHYVVIVTDPALVEKESLFRHIHDGEQDLGLTAIFAYGDITKLPRYCKTIVQSDDTRTGYYIKNKNANRFLPFALDAVDSSRVRTFANDLSQLPIKRDARSLGMADKVSFLEMYQAGNIGDLNIELHWDTNNSAKSLAAPIGVMAGGEVFQLDIHEAYHGCHGLVAGTTGSGKSEFLQAFILSLAIHYSPKEVAFVLVDFKGGDMARPFMAKASSPALPHLAATISNLSENILYRALVSFEAEMKSRQRILNEAAAHLGVDKLDINSYHKYYKGGRLETPLPHLIIIIDEFAQLKTQQPAFLAQLINVAQIGRSLGIHLILATQKPSGIVDPQIMSNFRFKVCLKVAEKQDSIDMINKPDAAMIKKPGRLYLQVGYDEIYECVQAGYSGADYLPTETFMPDEAITIQMTDHTANLIHSAKLEVPNAKSGKTQLEAVVAEIVKLGQSKHLSAKPLWLEMLPQTVVLRTLPKGTKGLCTASLGLVDFVREQKQRPLTVDLSQTGHIGLYGASGTGKTTFLQTMVYSMVCEYGYTPEELNLYAIDFGGRNLGYLESLPHVGGVVFANEEEKLSALLSLLEGIIDERKYLFAQTHCGTFPQYRAVSPTPLPAILVLIDNFAALRDHDMDAADRLTEIISVGKTFGVYFVITGSTKNAIHYKVTEHIASYFALKMNDPGDYLDLLKVRPPVLPEDIAGRGITVIGKEVVEFQTAVAWDGESEADRRMKIQRAYQEIASKWSGARPAVLLPDAAPADTEPSLAGIAASYRAADLPDAVQEAPDTLVLGMSPSGTLRYGISLSQEDRVCVCFDGVESASAYYQYLMQTIARYSGRRMVLLDDERARFARLAKDVPSCRYICGSAELDLFLEEWKPQLNARLEDPSGEHDRLFVLVADYTAFFEMISDEQAAFLRKVFRYIDSPRYGITFLCGFCVHENKSNDRLFLSMIVHAKNYLICPNCYNEAVARIETLPLVQNPNSPNALLCLDGKSTEVRW